MNGKNHILIFNVILIVQHVQQLYDDPVVM